MKLKSLFVLIPAFLIGMSGASVASTVAGSTATCTVESPGLPFAFYVCNPASQVISTDPTVASMFGVFRIGDTTAGAPKPGASPVITAAVNASGIVLTRMGATGSLALTNAVLRIRGLVAEPGYELVGANVLAPPSGFTAGARPFSANSPVSNEDIGVQGDSVGMMLDGTWAQGNGTTVLFDVQEFTAPEPPVVPLPAGLPLLVAAIGTFALIRRKRAA